MKTNEQPGTRAVLRHYRMSASKAREVLDLIRGKDVGLAREILSSTPREAGDVVGKVLASAVANAQNNDHLDPDELYVSACFADEGTTLKRWRPRARGRATRIRKRTCHITVIVSRLPEERLERLAKRQAASSTASRSRRVAASRRPATPAASSATTELDTEAPQAGSTGTGQHPEAASTLGEHGDEAGETEQVAGNAEADAGTSESVETGDAGDAGQDDVSAGGPEEKD
ncbi:MAG: 50S ribosomal protein L22 [Acidimicrobiales bacterium]